MKVHHFVTAGSTLEILVYRMLFTDGEERFLCPKPLCLVFPRDLCHAPRRRYTRRCAFLSSMDTIRGALPHTTPLCTTQGSPRARTRKKGPPRRITEVHL